VLRLWVNGKRYRGSIPEARVKAQAERAEHAIRDQVYEGTYGKQKTPAPGFVFNNVSISCRMLLALFSDLPSTSCRASNLARSHKC
jgi:hypothetical protein